MVSGRLEMKLKELRLLVDKLGMEEAYKRANYKPPPAQPKGAKEGGAGGEPATAPIAARAASTRNVERPWSAADAQGPGPAPGADEQPSTSSKEGASKTSVLRPAPPPPRPSTTATAGQLASSRPRKLTITSQGGAKM